jgi:hypothetical protein
MNEAATPLTLPPDDRAGQALRVADFMEQHPEGVTTKQIEAACDPGSVTKVLSDMHKKFGYVIRREHGYELCQAGTKKRRRLRYYLVSRPNTNQQELFLPP